MMAGPGRRSWWAARRTARDHARAGDGGFTLIELIAAMAIMGTVLASLTALFANSITGANSQSGRQVAIQLADDAIEHAHALTPEGLVGGRSKADSDLQWARGTSDPVLAPYLATMKEAWDPNAYAGQPVDLPVSGTTATVNSVVFTQNWYIGTCWQNLWPASSSDSACVATAPGSYVQFTQVVAAVTWHERHCPGGICEYVAFTLISCGGPPQVTAPATANPGDCGSLTNTPQEPVFGGGQTQPPPSVNNPGTQFTDVGVALSMQLTATGGALPIVWSATGLPTGLSIATNGLISGTPTAIGAYNVMVTATDAFPQKGTAAFTWNVTALPVLTNPGAQSTNKGTTVSLTMTCTGGSTPLVWTATGLPTGLSIDQTGKISGTAGTAGTFNPTVTVTDASKKTNSVQFKFTVSSGPFGMVTPADQTSAVTTLQMVASGGLPPYTWSMTEAPPLQSSFSINSNTGLITVRQPTDGKKHNVSVTAVDATGASTNTKFFWTVP